MSDPNNLNKMTALIASPTKHWFRYDLIISGENSQELNKGGMGWLHNE